MRELFDALTAQDMEQVTEILVSLATPTPVDDAPELNAQLVDVACSDDVPLRQREAAANALAVRNDESMERLLELTKSDNPDVRGVAAVGLAKSADETSLMVLIDLLGDDVNTVRNLAERGLIERMPNTRLYGIETLIQLLSHEVPLTRSPAARLLGLSEDERALEPLVEMLRSDDKWLGRMWAAKSLGDLGSAGAVDPLANTLKHDEKNRVRAAAAEAISQLKPDNATALLKAAMQDEDVGVQKAAEEGLQTLELS